MAMPDRESKMASMRRIDVMTNGGDCAGLYAALHAVVHFAVFGHDWEVVLIEDGALDSLQQPIGIRSLLHDDFDGTFIRQNGAVFGSTDAGTSFAFKSSDGSEQDFSDEAIQAMRECSLEGLVGFSGIAVGAYVILIRPAKISCDIAHVARRLKTAKRPGHRFGLLIVAEAVVRGSNRTQRARQRTLRRYRSYPCCAPLQDSDDGHTGHSVGAYPKRRNSHGKGPADGIGGRRSAVDQLAEVARDRMVAWRSRAVIDVPIEDAISAYQSVKSNAPVVAMDRVIGISFGDK